LSAHPPASPGKPSADVDSILVRIAEELGETPNLVLTRAGQPWVGLTAECAIYIAYDARTRGRIRQEGERLDWAARQGIPVPKVTDRSPDWLITARVKNDGATGGERYIEAALEAEQAIAAAPEPPPSVRGRPPAHGGGRWAGTVRLLRILRSPLSPREFRAARRAAAQLPRDTLAHGDFIPHNILFDSDAGTVNVIDWEFLNYLPAHSDLLLLWPRLPGAADRQRVLEEALRTTRDRRALGVLHHWLAVRRLADLVTKIPPGDWQRDRIAEARSRLSEARANAAAWGAAP
jgi:phosphotransferase family enzyme